MTLGGTAGGNVASMYTTNNATEQSDRQYALQLAQQQQQQQQQFQQQYPQAASVNIPVAQQLKRVESAVSVLETDSHIPIFTYVMIVVDTLVLAAELVLNYLWEGEVIVPFAENPTSKFMFALVDFNCMGRVWCAVDCCVVAF